MVVAETVVEGKGKGISNALDIVGSHWRVLDDAVARLRAALAAMDHEEHDQEIMAGCQIIEGVIARLEREAERQHAAGEMVCKHVRDAGEPDSADALSV